MHGIQSLRMLDGRSVYVHLRSYERLGVAVATIMIGRHIVINTPSI